MRRTTIPALPLHLAVLLFAGSLRAQPAPAPPPADRLADPACAVQVLFVPAEQAAAEEPTIVACMKARDKGWDAVQALMRPALDRQVRHPELWLVPLTLRGDPARVDARAAFAVVPRDWLGTDFEPVSIWQVADRVKGVLIVQVGARLPPVTAGNVGELLLTSMADGHSPTGEEGRAWLESVFGSIAEPIPPLPPEALEIEAPERGGPPPPWPPGPVEPGAIQVPCVIEAQCGMDPYAIGLRFRF